MDFIQRAEEDAILYFKLKYGLDVSNKAQRIKLSKEKKKEMLHYLFQQALIYKTQNP